MRTREAVTPADYEYAIELWPDRLHHLVRNLNVVPNWIDGGDRFWVKLEDEDGYRFHVFDALTGERRPAFDHDLLAKILRQQGLEADADALPLSHLELGENDQSLLAVTPGGAFRVDLGKGTAALQRLPTAAEVPGPRGQVLFLKDNDLWIRDPDGAEHAITDDGEPFHAWGAGNDYNTRKVAFNRGQLPALPTNVFWSPDGRLVLAERVDERPLEPYPYIEFVPADGSVRPKLHFIRHVLVGEAPRAQNFAIIDVNTGARTPLSPLPDGLLLRPDLGNVWWSDDQQFLYAVALTLDARLSAFAEFEVATGSLRIVHQETSPTFFDFNTYPYNSANVSLRQGGRQAIWYSQQDGWGHLYSIDIASGELSQLTHGPWAVADIIAVTDDQLFFTACGREAGRHPYHRYLYRIDLDGVAPNSGLQLLTPDDGDHGFPGEPTPIVGRILSRPAGISQMSPSALYFLDAWSRVDMPTRYILRNADGELIAEIGRCNIDALEATGWQPPEVFKASGANGSSDIFGVLIKPRDFDANCRYPVVEHFYGGPQIIVQPRSFAEGLNGAFISGQQTLADLGFVVALIDGPGTPYRSKAFHDLTYGDEDRWGVAHHRATLEDIGATRPWMDLDRVGVRGHSFGGYAAAMAMLREPDFYKVGVSSAGLYDIAWAPSGHESYLGLPDYGAGRHLKQRPDEVAPNHWLVSPSRLASCLSGRLLLVAGELDENIQPSGLHRFADQLINAGKTFDQLILPGRQHGFSSEPYFHKRSWDYFIEHLQGRLPCLHHMPDMKPGIRMPL